MHDLFHRVFSLLLFLCGSVGTLLRFVFGVFVCLCVCFCLFLVLACPFGVRHCLLVVAVLLLCSLPPLWSCFCLFVGVLLPCFPPVCLWCVGCVPSAFALLCVFFFVGLSVRSCGLCFVVCVCAWSWVFLVFPLPLDVRHCLLVVAVLLLRSVSPLWPCVVLGPCLLLVLCAPLCVPFCWRLSVVWYISPALLRSCFALCSLAPCLFLALCCLAPRFCSCFQCPSQERKAGNSHPLIGTNRGEGTH